MLLKVLLLVVLISLSCPGGSAKAVADTQLTKEGDVSDKVLDHEINNFGRSVWYQKQNAAMFTRMGRDRSVYGKAQASIADCVTLMAKSGVKGAFSKCKIHLQEAMKYCKGAAAKKTHKTACENMLVSIGIAVDECELQAEKHKKPSELCLAIVPKKKSRADCKAGQLFGQVPGNSTEPVCIDAPLDKRSKTQPLPLRLYQPWPERVISNGATAQQSSIDVVVHTIPIGQGDCNIITCNEDKNVIIFDCGSRGGNVFEEASNFDFILQYFCKAVSVTVLISHGDIDHYNQVQNILKPVITNRKPVIYGLLGGSSQDYDEDFFKWLVSITPNKQLGLISTNFCDNPAIHFEFQKSVINNNQKNQNGLLMKLSCNTCESNLLFSGDIEGRGATTMIKNNPNFLRSTHYKMAHHGASSQANKKRWLETILPEEVHVSHVYGGQYHHPRCEATELIEQLGTLGTSTTHPFTCFEGDGTPVLKNIQRRLYSTAPLMNEICLIEMFFKEKAMATTKYYCDKHQYFETFKFT